MKILVVGAGLSGSIIARELAQAGHKVTVIDSRNHIGGNAYDYTDPEVGVRVHKYGPHLFHTNNWEVVEYLSQFTKWIPYKHKVKALYNGVFLTLPVNKHTKEVVGEENILDVFFKPYTKKMWGVDLEDLDPSIMNRVPIRDDDNEYYFPNDKYQMLPEHGYTNMFSNMLNHQNINIILDVEFDKSMEKHYDHVFNSMPIDKYYDYMHGELPYRSIKFHHNVVNQERCDKHVTVNFTHTGPHTRYTEWKNIPGHCIHESDKTLLTYEEPCDYKDNNYERYYPVKDLKGENRETYRKYRDIENPKVTFIGRCGMYVYIDMDQAAASALAEVRRFMKNYPEN